MSISMSVWIEIKTNLSIWKTPRKRAIWNREKTAEADRWYFQNLGQVYPYKNLNITSCPYKRKTFPLSLRKTFGGGNPSRALKKSIVSPGNPAPCGMNLSLSLLDDIFVVPVGDFMSSCFGCEFAPIYIYLSFLGDQSIHRISWPSGQHQWQHVLSLVFH